MSDPTYQAPETTQLVAPPAIPVDAPPVGVFPVDTAPAEGLPLNPLPADAASSSFVNEENASPTLVASAAVPENTMKANTVPVGQNYVPDASVNGAQGFGINDPTVDMSGQTVVQEAGVNAIPAQMVAPVQNQTMNTTQQVLNATSLPAVGSEGNVTVGAVGNVTASTQTNVGAEANATISIDANVTVGPETNTTVSTEANTTVSTEANTTVAVATEANATITLGSNATVASPANVTVAVDPNATVAAPANVTVVVDSNATVASPANVTVVVDSNATIASPANVTVAVDSNATIASPANVTVAVDSNATIASPANVTVAVDSNATVASPSNVTVAVDSNATIASPANVTIAVDSNATIASQANVTDASMGNVTADGIDFTLNQGNQTQNATQPADAGTNPATNMTIEDGTGAAITNTTILGNATSSAESPAGVDVAIQNVSSTDNQTVNVTQPSTNLPSNVTIVNGNTTVRDAGATIPVSSNGTTNVESQNVSSTLNGEEVAGPPAAVTPNESETGSSVVSSPGTPISSPMDGSNTPATSASIASITDSPIVQTVVSPNPGDSEGIAEPDDDDFFSDTDDDGFNYLSELVEEEMEEDEGGNGLEDNGRRQLRGSLELSSSLMNGLWDEAMSSIGSTSERMDGSTNQQTSFMAFGGFIVLVAMLIALTRRPRRAT